MLKVSNAIVWVPKESQGQYYISGLAEWEQI